MAGQRGKTFVETAIAPEPPPLLWPPYFVWDLAAEGLLPQDWEREIAGFLAQETQHRLITEASPGAGHDEIWSFSVVTAPAIRERLGWLWKLYHGQLRRFASDSFDVPLFPSNRLDATITLNILEGRGAANIWHRDANPVSGLFFATSLAEDDGGELQFRSSDGRFAEICPRAGLFVCFRGSCEHQVAPLLGRERRLAFPMTYFTSATDQPFASENNRYEAPVDDL